MKSLRTTSLLCAGFALVSLSALGLAAPLRGSAQGGGEKDKAAAGASAKEFRGDPYLLDVDPVTGEPLGDVAKQVRIQHEGRDLRFAKKENADAFAKEPAKYLAAIDQKMVAAQTPLYPLDTCVVSGEKLGSMGAPVDVVYKNRLVRFCCKQCIKKLDAEGGSIVAKIDEAVIAKQGPAYASKTCPVSDEALGGEMGDPVDVVMGNRLVRLCCKSCKKQLDKEPLTFLHKLDQAAKAAPAGKG